MNYKPLEKEFTKNKFRLKQLVREGDVAIFHKVGLDPQPHDAGFEVVVIGRHNGYEIAGNKIEPSECYPSNEQWGTKGWSYRDLFTAEARYLRLRNGDVTVDLSEAAPVGETEEAPVPPVAPKSQRRARGSGLPEITFPEGEFSIKEAAALNPDLNPATVYLCVKDAEKNGVVKATRQERRAERGKPTQLFQKVS